MSTLNKNIQQTIQDFDTIKEAIIEKGVEIPDSITTAEYSGKIRQIPQGVFPEGTVLITENGPTDITEYRSADVAVKT